MLMLLSPSKTMDEAHAPRLDYTAAELSPHTHTLVQLMQRYDVPQLRALMDISEPLAALNYERYQHWAHAPAYEALQLFKGDVYEAMTAAAYTPEQRVFAQRHLRILSGLYGLIRPLDGIRPYRLEMGIPLPTPQGKNLYQFWGSTLTDAVNAALHESGSEDLLNLASQEYAKAVQMKQIHGRVIQMEFRVLKEGKLRTIGLFAKRARGAFAHHIITHGITSAEDLLNTQIDGYQFSPELSSLSGHVWFFVKTID